MKTTVAGRDIEYGVDEKTGIFGATWNGEAYSHATLAGLKGQLERQIKKKPVNIPVIQIEDDYREAITIEHGFIVGKHSGNGNLMVKWGDNPVEQIRHYRGKVLAANTDIKTLKALHAARKKADNAYNKFVEDNAFDQSKFKQLIGEE